MQRAVFGLMLCTDDLLQQIYFLQLYLELKFITFAFWLGMLRQGHTMKNIVDAGTGTFCLEM